MARERGSDLWLDGGHNPHGARAVAEALADLARDGRPVALVAGTLSNKDAVGFFSAFQGLNPKVYATGFEADAAASAQATMDAARAAGLEAEACGYPQDAIRRALISEGAPLHVLICGSLYLAGEILAASDETWPV
jgi:dihydrofolate synthase/folylpolyglutamate synthase